MQKFKFTTGYGQTLTINPPSARLYYRKYALAKTETETFEAIAEVCNNNDEKIPVTVDYLLDNFTAVDLQRFTANFPQWIANARDSDPN
ncbi:MAG: hypothetical protein NC177_14405 [Ruminococcus flavefaciens]|nr:hypothetical protein [Ruminococcus flavefaciens]